MALICVFLDLNRSSSNGNKNRKQRSYFKKQKRKKTECKTKRISSTSVSRTTILMCYSSSFTYICVSLWAKLLSFYIGTYFILFFFVRHHQLAIISNLNRRLRWSEDNFVWFELIHIPWQLLPFSYSLRLRLLVPFVLFNSIISWDGSNLIWVVCVVREFYVMVHGNANVTSNIFHFFSSFSFVWWFSFRIQSRTYVV